VVDSAEVWVKRDIWVRTPSAGGRAIPEAVRRLTEQRIQEHAKKSFSGLYSRIDVRFRGRFCYIDAFIGDEPAMRLCRLRYFDTDRWSFSLYTYSHERYETSCLASGDFWGPAEEGFDVAARLYLT
jgi:hypothetical protein